MGDNSGKVPDKAPGRGAGPADGPEAGHLRCGEGLHGQVGGGGGLQAEYGPVGGGGLPVRQDQAGRTGLRSC